MAVFEIPNLPNLISRNISVAEKNLKFPHCEIRNQLFVYIFVDYSQNKANTKLTTFHGLALSRGLIP